MRIVILAWGSLLWDRRSEFDDYHDEWFFDGPCLKLEFSRISRTRSGALSLVLDNVSGNYCQVAYAFSKRADLRDALCDLRSREGTTLNNIGIVFRDGSRTQSRNELALHAIREWIDNHEIDVAIWTDLQSNFEAICGKPFGLEATLSHIQSLDQKGKTNAIEYVQRAPTFIDTNLKLALQGLPYFRMHDR